MEKINLYVTDQICSTLENDAMMFEIFKKDGQTINRNKLLNKIILGYYDTYIAEYHNTFDRLYAEFSNAELKQDAARNLAECILKKIIMNKELSDKEYFDNRISLKPVKATEGLIHYFEKGNPFDESGSRALCRLLMNYCKKPFSDRERIVFKDNYDLLQRACAEHRKISFSTIWNPQKMHEVVPYKLAIGKEELFNYLLCAEMDEDTGIQKAKSYRLNRMSGIRFIRGNSLIEDTVENHLSMMKNYGPQFEINDDEEACVRLTEKGRQSFNRIYYGRPLVDRIEEKEGGVYYYFGCSKDHLFWYFKRFEKGSAVVIYPTDLKDRLIRFYNENLQVYERRNG